MAGNEEYYEKSWLVQLCDKARGSVPVSDSQITGITISHTVTGFDHSGDPTQLQRDKCDL
ncbi:hypothetical protein M514_13192 [Trichuris suis]|uniref:Uncharacterized protein n=1 Tax=Trichuris suis TaxID=68888 RepID=A0A085LLT7_9BILA|nr:hypothetical protein M513_13192 [Trichuris suis]KFD64345.1 hypothetical protein M514_13192 [Trichuris suis]